MTLRRGCRWLHGWIPLDGLGPIRPGEDVSDGQCETCAALAMLGLHVGKPLPWLRRVLLRIAQLEGQGDGNFGGTSVLAWWLLERCKPVEPMSKAKHAQIKRLAGSQENYHRCMRMATLPGPKRLQRGWSADDVTSYLEQRWAERKAKAMDWEREKETQQWWFKRLWLWPGLAGGQAVDHQCEALTAPEILEDEHA